MKTSIQVDVELRNELTIMKLKENKVSLEEVIREVLENYKNCVCKEEDC